MGEGQDEGETSTPRYGELIPLPLIPSLLGEGRHNGEDEKSSRVLNMLLCILTYW